MQAVIKSGGKQYRVASGESVRLETVAGEVGSAVWFDEVLGVGDGENFRSGTPVVAGARVRATIVAHGLADKVRIFKMRRRKHSMKTQGHRQQFTDVRIEEIVAG